MRWTFNFVKGKCTPLPQAPVNIYFLRIATNYMVENNIILMPMNNRESILLYVELVDVCVALMNMQLYRCI